MKATNKKTNQTVEYELTPRGQYAVKKGAFVHVLTKEQFDSRFTVEKETEPKKGGK